MPAPGTMEPEFGAVSPLEHSGRDHPEIWHAHREEAA